MLPPGIEMGDSYLVIIVFSVSYELTFAVNVEGTKEHTFNIAGGCTWRTTNRAYIKDYYDLLSLLIVFALYSFFQTFRGILLRLSGKAFYILPPTFSYCLICKG